MWLCRWIRRGRMHGVIARQACRIVELRGDQQPATKRQQHKQNKAMQCHTHEGSVRA